MIDAERSAVVELRDRGVIGADVLRQIERDLDLEVMLLREGTPDGTPQSGKQRGASAALSGE
jgi:hypothetical protein